MFEVKGNTCEDPNLRVPVFQKAEFSQATAQTSREGRDVRERRHYEGKTEMREGLDVADLEVWLSASSCVEGGTLESRLTYEIIFNIQQLKPFFFNQCHTMWLKMVFESTALYFSFSYLCIHRMYMMQFTCINVFCVKSSILIVWISSLEIRFGVNVTFTLFIF